MHPNRCPGLVELADGQLARLSFNGGGAEVALFSNVSPSKSPGENEDAYLVLPLPGDGVLLAVADGVGGHDEGGEASKKALRILREQVAGAGAETARDAILAALEEANRLIQRELSGNAATTLVAAEVHQRRLRTYNVGDSGALLFGGQGRLKLQTISHSPVGYALEAGVIDEKTALGHDERHLVSNVLGDASMHVSMSAPLRVRPRDTLVLASDGLFDNFLIDEVVEHLRGGRLEDRLAALASLCGRRMASDEGKPDDLTVLALRLRR